MCSENSCSYTFEKFKKYLRVDVNHLWYAAGLKCGAKSVFLTPAFPIERSDALVQLTV